MRQLSQILISFYFVLYAYGSTAQTGNRLNININNGLPSNHVYNSLIDRYGYLWLATPKGVVKYNGYSFKVFGFSEGLPREDVWQLVEDRRGRIWLGCIADEIGYIFNDRYYGINIDDNTIYPQNIRVYKDGIMFTCNNNGRILRLYTYDTTLKKIEIPYKSYIEAVEYIVSDKDKKFSPRNVSKPIHFFSQNEEVNIIVNSNLLTYTLGNDSLTQKRKIEISDTAMYMQMLYSQNILFRHQIVTTSETYGNEFRTITLADGVCKKYTLTDYGIREKIKYTHKNPFDDSTLYFITDNATYQFNMLSKPKLINTIPLKLFNEKVTSTGSDVKSILESSFWGTISCTENNGINAILNHQQIFETVTYINLNGYVCLGRFADLSYCWWNEGKQTMIFVDDTGKLLSSYRFKKNNFHKIVPYTKEYSIILGKQTYLINNRTKDISPFLTQKKPVDKIGPNLTDAIADGNDFICISNFGFYRISPNDTANVKYIIDHDRYLGLVHLPKSNEYLAYNNSRISTYVNGYTQTLDKNALKRAGLGKIEKILVDTTWNSMIIKDNNGLFFFDKRTLTAHKIVATQNLNIRNAQVEICGNKLILIGQFGICVLKIAGHNMFETSLLISNAKNEFYKYIFSYQLSKDNVILNTDRGVLRAGTICDSSMLSTPPDLITKKYTFVYSYHSVSKILHAGDTLELAQNDLKIIFDIINPYGSGQLRFSVKKTTGEEGYLNSNEFTFSSQTPGSYQRYLITADDDVWRSHPIEVTIYIQPLWYQTSIAKKLLLILIIISLFILLTISIVITRKLVLRAAQKRQLRMELELKSIYAQINPHFIFNSLNSALLLVSKNQMDDAYNHISKFSRLLRSYIKSSRNKFILLADEIRNLTNYIDLQQVRFKNKFDYKITVADDIDIIETKIPSLLLQPFVENAIEHGLLAKEDKGMLSVEFKTIHGSNKILCIIDDNGIGRKESKQNKIPNPIKEESYGELLIKDLVNIFNKYEHMNITVSYADKVAPLTGTIVYIEIDAAK